MSMAPTAAIAMPIATRIAASTPSDVCARLATPRVSSTGTPGATVSPTTVRIRSSVVPSRTSSTAFGKMSAWSP